MLTRATRREAHRSLSRSAITSYERLLLPWLCPAVSLASEQQRAYVSNPTYPRPRRKDTQKRKAAEPKTTLHTNATHQSPEVFHFASKEEYIPFDNVTTSIAESQTSKIRMQLPFQFKPFDLSNITTVQDSLFPPEPIPLRASKNIATGDVADLQQNLYACIHVGRHGRAAALVRRFQQIYQTTAPELLDAHNQYLTGLLESLVREPSAAGLIAMQKWFEVDIRGRGVRANASTISIMIKASISVLTGVKLERTIRRYLHMARAAGPEVEEQTLASSIFLDAEWSLILRLLPEHFASATNTDAEIVDHHPVELRMDKPVKQTKDFTADEANDPGRFDLNPVDQKGLGLQSLKHSLSSFPEHISLAPLTLGTENIDKEALYQHQLRLERDVVDSALTRWRSEAELMRQLRNSGEIVAPKLGTFLWEWVETMVKLVEADIHFFKNFDNEKSLSEKQNEIMFLGPYLDLLRPEKFVAIGVMGFISAAADGMKWKAAGLSELLVVNVVRSIGKAMKEEMIIEFSKRAGQLGKLKTLPSKTRLKALRRVIRRQGPHGKPLLAQTQEDVGPPSERTLTQESAWTDALILKLGAYVVSKILKVAKLPVKKQDPSTGRELVMFQHIASQGSQWRNGKKHGTILFLPEFISRLKSEPAGAFLAKHLPMLVEPKKWTGLTEGGFLTHKIKAVRFRDSSYLQENYVKAAVKNGSMDQVFHGLNIISKLPWRINREVFKVMTEAWNAGEAIAGLAPENPDLPYPPKPADDSNPKLESVWRNIVRQIENEKTGLHSERCYQNFQLEVARAFADQTFYCPQTLDYRGRAYPITPYFNHIGADHCRGLMIFAKGKPIGTKGLSWLKIHLANVYGYDKASLKEREDFTMSHLADIYDSANNPLAGKRWWLTAEDPWQCLASCLELRNALEAPVPAEFVSHLPVHQDGTCNGLQHYAALGGDVLGARQVNLEPGDRPADVYTAVAELVKDQIKEDAENGGPEAQLLSGKITRKVVKQTVMTNVYGVTYHGAKEQVKSQLVDIFPKPSMENPIHFGKLSSNIALKIFKALQTMFGGARAIQDWLGECAGRISVSITPAQLERLATEESSRPSQKFRNSKSFHSPDKTENAGFKTTVVWTTPLGMPIAQPYRKTNAKVIRTNLQQITLIKPSLSDPINKRKQLQGFPPNFIHSLDATHMLLTAIKCDELGLTFASVHDSFWTHACDVPVMNDALRDAFIRMHSEPIIERLREEFIARHNGCLFRALVNPTTAVQEKIVLWRKSRSLERNKKIQGLSPEEKTKSKAKNISKYDELLLEYKRLKLLQSDDPKDQILGKEMVTPASILQSVPNWEETVCPLVAGPVLRTGFGTDDPTSFAQLEETPDTEFTLMEEGLTGDAPTKASGKSQSVASVQRKINVWLPMIFPPAPQKGAFNVSVVKDSQYFFS